MVGSSVDCIWHGGLFLAKTGQESASANLLGLFCLVPTRAPVSGLISVLSLTRQVLFHHFTVPHDADLVFRSMPHLDVVSTTSTRAK